MYILHCGFHSIGRSVYQTSIRHPSNREEKTIDGDTAERELDHVLQNRAADALQRFERRVDVDDELQVEDRLHAAAARNPPTDTSQAIVSHISLHSDD